MRILRAADHVPMSWKNGLGVTREVALAPRADGRDGFSWRLSLATIQASGPFSLFPGIDRTIVALAGETLALRSDGRELTRLSALGEPFAFPGEVMIEGVTEGGATTDLNIMTHRGEARHRMERLSWSGTLNISSDSDVTMLVCTSPLNLAVAGEAAVRALDSEDVVVIDRGETVAVTSECQTVAYGVVVDAIA